MCTLHPSELTCPVAWGDCSAAPERPDVSTDRAVPRFLLQFPLYWFSVPAILKGWMDRVLCQGFAFDFPEIYDSGLLKVCAAAPWTTAQVEVGTCQVLVCTFVLSK